MQLSHTDYWQRTHYGFRVHNGPFLHLPDVKGDFVLATTVTTAPEQRFDQAGETRPDNACACGSMASSKQPPP
jgi:regulation of enolase protein 1 (concanavalin A-like superfamily)